ncbi:MAG: DUF120 domain-containing protein [Euryarchaeota archaeon]|nr:DUF120 domain-containing protein [Euryarchaeota archaeon]
MPRLEPRLLAVLKELALMGALDGCVSIRSEELGRRMGVSQQSASSYLLKLAEGGYISRQMRARGQSVRLAPKGKGALGAEHEAYRRIFSGAGSLEIAGRVVSGMGEGQYYLSRAPYKRRMREILGAEPFKGTLNLRISGRDGAKVEMLRSSEGEAVAGFEEDGRTFGAVRCFRAEIGGIAALVVMPVRSHYSDVLEVVAAVHLRAALGLRDDDEVSLKVILPGLSDKE